MSDNTLDTLKFLLKDSRKLAEQFTEFKISSQRSLEQFTEFKQQLNNVIADLEERIAQLEKSQSNVENLAVSNFSQSFSNEEIEHLLDLPLEKILDVYSEFPQLLEVICRRVAVSINEDSLNPILERNNQGNYWVLQLREQGFFLLPRFGSFVRMTALESLQRLFESEGKIPDLGNHEFLLKQPAKLELLKRNQRWQLAEKGLIQFGEAPLEFRWQQEIRQMRDRYQEFTQMLEKVGEAGLQATVISQRWQQELEQRYGEPVSIMINTCMPMAYAIYKGPTLVPCHVILTKGIGLVQPAWDRGVPWDTSIYAKSHSRNVLRSSPDHPILANQPYFKEITYLKEQKNQTWAIANTYQDASRIISLLNGNWGSLEDIPS
ncbi:MAG: hypothetical protein VKL41_00350 [Snowella sp.]|nr:hypothetical protein [Snowella sp.]